MPLYSYRCPSCQTVKEVTRPVTERDRPAACFACWRDEYGEPTPMPLVPSVLGSVWHPTRSTR